jgi:serine/threonine-protein phosphatase 5
VLSYSQFHQAYYRRAVANTAILRHADAINDWKMVVKKQPSDKVARAQHDACQKVIKRDAFLKAIEAPDAPSAAEGLDLANMAIPSDYDGVKLGDKMTLEFVEDTIERFKNGKKLPLKYVYQIVLAVKEICYNEPTMVETHVDQGKKITVCGDTHGSYLELPSVLWSFANISCRTIL